MATREDYDIILRATDQTSAAFSSAQRNAAALEGAVGTLKTALGTLGLALGAGQIVQFARDAVKELADIGSTAKAVGTTTDALQALRFEIAQNGGDAKDADAALRRFAEAASKAGTSNSFLSRVLKENGVSLRDSNGQIKDSAQLLSDYAKLVSNTTEPANRLRLATEAFGRQAGPQMVAVLQQIAREGLPGVIERLREAGIIIDGSLIDKADEVDRKWNTVTKRLGNFLKTETMQAIEELMADPNVSQLLDILTGKKTFADFTLKISVAIEEGSLADKVIGFLESAADTVGIAGKKIPRVTIPVGVNNFGEVAGIKSYINAVNEANAAFENFGKTATRIPNDAAKAFDKQIAAVEKHIAVMQANAATVGQGAAAQELLRVQMQLIEGAHSRGISTTGAYAAKIAEIARRAGEAAEALARAKIQSDITFQRGLIGLSKDEIEIAQQLRTLYGDDIPRALESAEAAALRFNAALKDAKSDAVEFAQTFVRGIMQGKTATEALQSAVERLISKLVDRMLDSLISSLFSMFLPGAGGVLSGGAPLGQGGIGSRDAIGAKQVAGSERGGVTVNVVEGAGGNTTKKRTRRGANGEIVTDILTRANAGAMANGDFDGALGSRYAARPTTTMR